MAQTREILLHGHRLCYRAGVRGPLLVLVHGITNSSASWEPVLAQLATRFTVLAPDLLGHGASPRCRTSRPVHTARSVVDIGGERVSATDKLYLGGEAVPTLIRSSSTRRTPPSPTRIACAGS